MFVLRRSVSVRHRLGFGDEAMHAFQIRLVISPSFQRNPANGLEFSPYSVGSLFASYSNLEDFLAQLDRRCAVSLRLGR